MVEKLAAIIYLVQGRTTHKIEILLLIPYIASRLLLIVVSYIVYLYVLYTQSPQSNNQQLHSYPTLYYYQLFSDRW